MSTRSTPSSKRPELLATILRVDLSDVFYKDLAANAARVGLLLDDPAVQADPDVVGSLDDLLGEIYCLILSRHHEFEDRPNQPIELKAVRVRAESVGRGEVRIDGKWMAGWYFNSALLRGAAVYHRLLKVVVADPQTKDHVPKLLPRVQRLYQSWRNASWSNQAIQRVHDEVNTLKHRPQGVHHGRTASYEDALGGIVELLDLVEAWRKSAAARTP